MTDRSAAARRGAPRPRPRRSDRGVGSQGQGLSGGIRRRLGLAQALVGDPELVVLDEPDGRLDPEQRLRFRDMVCRVGEDRTVV
jgi:ABC-2 type transport system ATP-binding protein